MIRTALSRRLALLRERMADAGMDALLVLQRENVRYLTGFTGSAGVVLVTRRSVHLITDFRYQLQARQEVKSARIIIQKGDWTESLSGVVSRAGGPIVWCDETAVSLERARMLKKRGVRIRGTHDPLAVLRQTKDDRELRNIRLAVRRAEESFYELKDWLRPGISERAVALKLEDLMRARGSRRAAFDTIVASGRNGAKPHAAASDRRIARGDLVTIDFGAEANGYVCDITRTICLGRPSAKQREVYALVLRAQEAARANVRPGALCRDVDAAARAIIAEAGHAEHFGHATGHGVGLLVHEGPSVSARSQDVLREGMVCTIEPGVYLPGWGGVRIEDMVRVTRTGAAILTTLPRSL